MIGQRRALVASPTNPAEAAAHALLAAHDWVSPDEADMLIALGGDGYMLQTLHMMLERHRIVTLNPATTPSGSVHAEMCGWQERCTREVRVRCSARTPCR